MHPLDLHADTLLDAALDGYLLLALWLTAAFAISRVARRSVALAAQARRRLAR